LNTITFWKNLATWEQTAAQRHAEEEFLDRTRRANAVLAEETKTRRLAQQNYREGLAQLEAMLSAGIIGPGEYAQKKSAAWKLLKRDLALNREVTSVLLNMLRG
jgi:hypothetical protein